MRIMRKLLAMLMTCMMMAMTLCFSGCIIIVSNDVVEDGVTTVRGINLKAFAMRFYVAGLVYEQSESGFMVVQQNDEGRKIVIPDERKDVPITRIKAWAFDYTDIIKVEIGENVSYIGMDAFYGCEDLKKAKFKETVGWKIDGEMIDSSYLEDPKEAAELLKKGGVWTR